MQGKNVFIPSHKATFLLLSGWDLWVAGMLLSCLGCLPASQEMLLTPHRLDLVELSPHLLLAFHFSLHGAFPQKMCLRGPPCLCESQMHVTLVHCGLQEMKIPKSMKNDSMTIYSIVNHSRQVNPWLFYLLLFCMCEYVCDVCLWFAFICVRIRTTPASPLFYHSLISPPLNSASH